MKMLKMCLNWKVLVGLVAVGLAIYAVAPDMVVAALPILLLALCPLSMLFMMKAMHGNQGETQGKPQVLQETDETREEDLTRLRAQRVALADQIDAFERDESRAARDRS
jgi:uncharacterized membrane protein